MKLTCATIQNPKEKNFLDFDLRRLTKIIFLSLSLSLSVYRSFFHPNCMQKGIINILKHNQRLKLYLIEQQKLYQLNDFK